MRRYISMNGRVQRSAQRMRVINDLDLAPGNAIAAQFQALLIHLVATANEKCNKT